MLLHWSQTTQSIVCLLHHSILLLVSFYVLCRDRAFKRDLIKQTTSVVNCISIIKSRNAQISYLNTLIIQSFTGITFPTPRQIIASCHPIRVKEKKLRKINVMLLLWSWNFSPTSSRLSIAIFDLFPCLFSCNWVISFLRLHLAMFIWTRQNTPIKSNMSGGLIRFVYYTVYVMFVDRFYANCLTSTRIWKCLCTDCIYGCRLDVGKKQIYLLLRR